MRTRIRHQLAAELKMCKRGFGVKRPWKCIDVLTFSSLSLSLSLLSQGFVSVGTLASFERGEASASLVQSVGTAVVNSCTAPWGLLSCNLALEPRRKIRKKNQQQPTLVKELVLLLLFRARSECARNFCMPRSKKTKNAG